MRCVNDVASGGKPLRLLKKIAVYLTLLTALAVCASFGVWKVLQHLVAGNERAPHLARIAEPPADFTYSTLDGEPRHLAASKGKVVFVDLWGTWCLQCVAEMPTLQKLYDHYRNDPQVEFLIVSRLDSPAAVRRYARRNHLDLPFYTMEDAAIPPSMQLHQFPSTFIYAPDGTLAARHTASADWSAPEVIDFIDKLKQ